MTTLLRGARAFVVAAGLLLASHALADAQSTKPCQPTLAACPIHGCAEPGTSHALLNERKRTLPPDTAPTVLTLDDFEALQAQAAQRLGEKQQALSKQAWAKLQTLDVAAAATVSFGVNPTSTVPRTEC